MSLKLLTFAAIAATAQAQCADMAAETKKMSECSAKLNTADMTDKAKMCAYFQGSMACYPACYCDDPAMKETMAAAEKTYEDLLKSVDVTCTIKCGAGSALAPGMALTLALMVAARLYE